MPTDRPSRPSPRKRVVMPDDSDDALIKAVAMDIGKDTVAYIERMYPQAISAASSSFRLSLRNHIYNQIMSAIKITDPDDILKWLTARRKHRRKIKEMQKVLDETDWEHYRATKPKEP